MWIIPILFFGIFFPLQVFLVNAYDFSEWKGGGMAMFSSNDHPNKRLIVFYVYDNKGKEFRTYFETASMIRHRENAAMLPSLKIITNMYDYLANETLFVVNKYGDEMYVTDRPNLNAVAPFDITQQDVRIELWKMDKTEHRGDVLYTENNIYDNWYFPKSN